MNKQLSVLSLSLITICSVDSIRNLPAAAMAGNQLVHYFLLALIFFLLPCAFIAIWFSTTSHQGIYGWVKQGLGQPFACMAIWFQCVQNVLIYPTFFSFIAGTLLYGFSPKLITNHHFVFFIILSLIWGLTWINLKGIHVSSRFNSFCTLVGLLLPFTIILAMGGVWYFTHSYNIIIQSPTVNASSWTSLTAIMLSFCGLEIAAVHAKESQPGSFPKAMIISVIVIFLTMLFGALTLAMIIPLQQLSFISSIPQLIDLFFREMHCGEMAFFINGLIALGCIGTANNWIIAPIKGLSFAIDEGFLSPKLMQMNPNHAPARLLTLQALIVSIISCLFLIFPSINASYRILLNAATQLYLLMYILLFLSALRIGFSANKLPIIVIIWSFLGLLGISIGLGVSFIPPASSYLNFKFLYALLSGLFLIFVIFFPLIVLNKGFITKPGCPEVCE
ncbi:amino acid antiporter [Legionella lansingensis]|uniref:Amino acid antiporter n=1 Tax=Legionella lansingensis TaxID=45067 RepID=A0A0W0VTW5_9GAMM|nr:APC family permease [Legionella lansingensis]KTD23580.1 amino acid antiporter [Legionella lansingensis]SNV52331.1 amino acid antiporter [Legionella lansingensis]